MPRKFSTSLAQPIRPSVSPPQSLEPKPFGIPLLIFHWESLPCRPLTLGQGHWPKGNSAPWLPGSRCCAKARPTRKGAKKSVPLQSARPGEPELIEEASFDEKLGGLRGLRGWDPSRDSHLSQDQGPLRSPRASRYPRRGNSWNETLPPSGGTEVAANHRSFEEPRSTGVEGSRQSAAGVPSRHTGGPSSPGTQRLGIQGSDETGGLGARDAGGIGVDPAVRQVSRPSQQSLLNAGWT
mmetsp:Transcript_38309/g.59807  ORF Transcript_38309/g.59807 Transcript_38309/m.59807 type:complete len:238 (+) Transcript_38309:670-1383(+)